MTPRFLFCHLVLFSSLLSSRLQLYYRCQLDPPQLCFCFPSVNTGGGSYSLSLPTHHRNNPPQPSKPRPSHQQSHQYPTTLSQQPRLNTNHSPNTSYATRLEKEKRNKKKSACTTRSPHPSPQPASIYHALENDDNLILGCELRHARVPLGRRLRFRIERRCAAEGVVRVEGLEMGFCGGVDGVCEGRKVGGWKGVMEAKAKGIER